MSYESSQQENIAQWQTYEKQEGKFCNAWVLRKWVIRYNVMNYWHATLEQHSGNIWNTNMPVLRYG